MASRHRPRDRVRTQDVLLDIGQDVGALVLYTPPELVGAEVEVSLKLPGSRRVHTDIQERLVGGRLLVAGVYPDLPAGHYVVWMEGDRPAREFTIRGGEVTEVALPAG